MKKIFTMVALIGAVMCANAQTKEELKAERQAMKSEINSQKTVDRDAKIAELAEMSHTVQTTGLNSVDGLSTSCMGFLNTVISTNDVLKEYKTEVKDNGDGEVDITKYKAHLDDYVNLANGLALASTQIAEASKELAKATDDVKTVKDPRQVRPVKISVNFLKEALPVCADEVAFLTKLVNNLIQSIKASDNY